MGCASASYVVGTAAAQGQAPASQSVPSHQELREQKAARPPATGTEHEQIGGNPMLLNSIGKQQSDYSMRVQKASEILVEKKCIPRKPYMKSLDALRDMLEAKGVSTGGFGSGTSKSLEDLLSELEASACYFELDDDAAAGASRRPKVLRVVEPVYIRLCWRGLFLVLESKELSDGQMRERRMFLSDKKRARDGGGLFSTIIRTIHEELAIPKRELLADDVLLYRPDTYCFEVEALDSASYPGLQSEYRTHHVQVDILESGLETFKHCGLPDCRDFTTRSASKAGEPKVQSWRWYTIEHAVRSGIVKFPPEGLLAKLERERARPMEGARVFHISELRDMDALRNILEHNKVDVQTLGTGFSNPDHPVASLLRELHAGESTLEVCHALQRLRLVKEPVFVQVRWGDKVCVEVEQTLTSGSSDRRISRNSLVTTNKVPRDGDMFTAAVRGLAENFQLPQDKVVLNESVRFRADEYCCIAENMDSESYPGFACVRVTHYCRIDILEAGLPHFQGRGLREWPQTFNLTDKHKAKVTHWEWIDISEARRNAVKGFPEVAVSQGGHDSSNYPVYKPVLTAEIDLPMLRKALEMGGIWPSAWGELEHVALASLLWELRSGFSVLEAHDKTGKVRRLLEPTLVHVMAHTSNPEEDGFIEEAKDTHPLLYRPDIGRFEIEHADVLSYPGLPCVHQARTLQFEQVPDMLSL